MRSLGRRLQAVDAAGGEVDRERIQERPAERKVRWNLVLTWFMRLLAALWIAKGLGAWSTLLGIGGPVPRFEARGLGFQATVVYFAVIDPVAAVGLWLTSSWGGVLWLLAVMSHLILAVFFPAIVPAGVLAIGGLLVLIALYLAISWLAAAES